MTEHPAGFGATFEVLSADELDRVKALYAPLAEAVRELIDATIDGFLATHGPPPAPPTPKVAQTFHGNVGQVAGDKIVNRGPRKK